jgi:FkbM family methyltransferase
MNSVREALKNTIIGDAVRAFRNARALQNERAAQRRRRSFYSKFIGTGDLVFDVGANAGDRTLLFSDLNATVVAIEPQASCFRVLQQKFGQNQRVKLVNNALGPQEGTAEMMVSDVDVLSSLSPEWIKTVTNSGRFPEVRWERKETVQLTTLDKLIEIHGCPVFIKIDVEGFEYEVLRGLSRAVPAVSFEFTPEYFDSTFACIKHLQSLGSVEFNYSIGESLELASSWLTGEAIQQRLRIFSCDHVIFGDIYARFRS